MQEAVETVDEHLQTGRVDESDQPEIRDKLARLKQRLAEVSMMTEST